MTRAACSVCGAQVEAGARFCPHCGNPLPDPSGFVCPACSTLNLPGDAFCEACGQPLPPARYLVVTESGLRLNLFTDDRAATVLGRSDPLSGITPDLDLAPFGAEAAGISRRHARVTRKDDQYWIEDLNSVNLTYLNNQRLTPDRPCALKDGDLLRLGQMLLTYRAG
jgi:FHA domain/Double zinc ribbon